MDALRFAPDLPSAIIEFVAISMDGVAVCPRSPIGYNELILDAAKRRVAVCPRSPIGYNSFSGHDDRIDVAVCPRSPIGYNPFVERVTAAYVAVCPRSPIGYNLPEYHYAVSELRFAPDLPSAIMIA